MGDVHLLAGVGAVIGWWDPVLIFFIAPFSGLLWAATSALLEKMGKQYKEIPYGPHLAVATLIVVFCSPAVHWVWSIAMPGVQMPAFTSEVTSEKTTEFSTELSSEFTSGFTSEIELRWVGLTDG